MGQMTMGVLLGVGTAKEPVDYDAWDDVLEAYLRQSGTRPVFHLSTRKNSECIIGFWVAVGGCNGCDLPGYPELDLNFTIDNSGFLTVPKYRDAYNRASAAWYNFTRWVLERLGVSLGTPSLWLVWTEVA